MMAGCRRVPSRNVAVQRTLRSLTVLRGLLGTGQLGRLFAGIGRAYLEGPGTDGDRLHRHGEVEGYRDVT